MPHFLYDVNILFDDEKEFSAQKISAIVNAGLKATSQHVMHVKPNYKNNEN